VSSGVNSTLDVRIVPYNKPTQVADKPSNGGTGEPYIEEWLPGVFDSQMNATNRIDVLVNFEHERGIGGVVGRGKALWSTNDGAYGSFRMLSTQNADTALELVNEGVATGISLEAIPIKNVIEDGVVKRAKARLVNIALCRMAVQYGEVGALAERVDERGERAAGDPLERRLPAVTAADLEGGDPEAVPVLVGQVRHEAFCLHRPHQVVGRGPGQCERRRQPVEADWVGLAGEVAQHPQGAGGGGDIGRWCRRGWFRDAR